MKEFDLKSIWDGADQQAEQWYQHLRPELIAKAKKQNDSVLHKIQRLTMMEIITGGISLLVLLYFIRAMSVWIIGGTGIVFLCLIYISFHQYRLFKQKADQVPTLNILASTEAYLKLINDYRKRLNRIAVLLMPFSILLGLFLGFHLNDVNDYSSFFKLKTWVILLPILLVLSVVSIYLTKWYYSYFIGSREKELQTVVDSLKDELQSNLDID